MRARAHLCKLTRRKDQYLNWFSLSYTTIVVNIAALLCIYSNINPRLFFRRWGNKQYLFFRRSFIIKYIKCWGRYKVSVKYERVVFFFLYQIPIRFAYFIGLWVQHMKIITFISFNFENVLSFDAVSTGIVANIRRSLNIPGCTCLLFATIAFFGLSVHVD